MMKNHLSLPVLILTSLLSISYARLFFLFFFPLAHSQTSTHVLNYGWIQWHCDDAFCQIYTKSSFKGLSFPHAVWSSHLVIWHLHRGLWQPRALSHCYWHSIHTAWTVTRTAPEGLHKHTQMQKKTKTKTNTHTYSSQIVQTEIWIWEMYICLFF